ncbi:ABC transporter substrate-binding protein [Uliginosibacterium sp. H3]|uniref:ABC transporter substrate-binding protein n=1 Tax=Uliginosibacterium silvisoli TaxID=3114758 RepID=A0ABU6K2H9_9RHOO|nr:ABC transporter substrate-binding protein [Uliginosibacterium sp. H3]
MRFNPSKQLAAAALVAAASAMPMWAYAAFSQSPMLDKLVQEKKLPPVDQRLPAKPQVIKPLVKVGTYGGTLRTALRGNGDANAILRLVGNQNLVRWTMDFNNVEANLAESWTVNADASEYTFVLRKGTRWSDGTPFTADDIIFSMNDVVANKGYTSALPAMFAIKDQPPVVTKTDDYTIKFKFAGPYITFLEQLATPVANFPTMWQKKYCSQFHPKYNTQINDLMAKEKAKDWGQLFRNKCGEPTDQANRWVNPDRPTLDPWVIKEGYGGSATKVVLERNPYFWQVDTAGKQLPYIDRVQLQVISEVETIVLAAINGQLDFMLRHVSGIQNRPVLAENQAKGGYKIFNSENVNANAVGLWLNHSTKNEKLRKLIRNHDFRQALSQATDRKEINDIIFLGQATPWQSGPLQQSKWYNEKLGKQYLNYDPKLANELLDKVGLTKKDADGFRLYPDGGRVSIGAIAQIAQSTMVDTLDLIRKQWAKVGVELVIQASERTLYYDRAAQNNFDLSTDVFPGGMDAPFNPRAYLAFHPTESRMSLEWTKYYLTNGKQGEEPSPSMKKRLALYDQWLVAKTKDEGDRLFKEILEEAANEFEVIGTVRPAVETGVRNAKLTNLYEKMPSGWTYPTPGPALLQQWFFATGK